MPTFTSATSLKPKRQPSEKIRKANHLTYLGDVTIGRDGNIGAGTIVCNYDGFQKYRTKIGDRVQVGSDSTLVAPISLGDDVYVATATTLRHDIPAGALAFNERARASA